MKTNATHETESHSLLKTKRILVPLDFSGKASEAITYAVVLAKFIQAKIILLHVIEPAYAGYAGPDPTFNYMPQYTEKQPAAARKEMRQIAAESIPAGFLAKTVVRVGDASHEIIKAAKGLKASLIVQSTHGRTGLSHLLMGSTAERVVRLAPCPVLTLRSPDDFDAPRKARHRAKLRRERNVLPRSNHKSAKIFPNRF